MPLARVLLKAGSSSVTKFVRLVPDGRLTTGRLVGRAGREVDRRVDRRAGVGEVAGVDRKGRRRRTAVLHEFDLAGRDVGVGEPAGRRRNPIGAVEHPKFAALDVLDVEEERRAVRIGDVEVARRQHRRAALRDRQIEIVEHRRVVDGGDVDGGGGRAGIVAAVGGAVAVDQREGHRARRGRGIVRIVAIGDVLQQRVTAAGVASVESKSISSAAPLTPLLVALIVPTSAPSTDMTVPLTVTCASVRMVS